jgi:hypothetical protein
LLPALVQCQQHHQLRPGAPADWPRQVVLLQDLLEICQLMLSSILELSQLQLFCALCPFLCIVLLLLLLAVPLLKGHS